MNGRRILQMRQGADGRDPVHPFARLRKTLVLGMCALRLYFALAELHAHFASGAEGLAVAEECRNPDCDANGREQLDGFCFTCTANLAHEGRELEKELDHLLDLEAQFVQHCLEHGHPHPHL